MYRADTWGVWLARSKLDGRLVVVACAQLVH
jgi:hypothetical protein